MKERFKKLYNKYLMRKLLKAMVRSLMFSSLFMSVSSVLAYMLMNEYSFTLVLTLSVILFIILTFMMFKPSECDFAREIDSLGLNQRAVTMYEHLDDESAIAGMQREDAMGSINRIHRLPSLLKEELRRIICSFTGFTLALAISLAMNFINPTVIVDAFSPPMEYYVTYHSSNGGSLIGNAIQRVDEGDDATMVIAVPEHDYVFIMWSDGLQTPYRVDREVHSDIEVEALFSEVELDDICIDMFNENVYSKLNEDDGKDLGENTSDAMGTGMNDGNKDNDDQYFSDNTKVIDGETYAGDNVFKMHMEDMLEQLKESSTMDNGSRDAVNGYFDTIRK